jgi:hypothetical protein
MRPGRLGISAPSGGGAGAFGLDDALSAPGTICARAANAGARTPL